MVYSSGRIVDKSASAEFVEWLAYLWHRSIR